MVALTLNMKAAALALDDDQFYRLCQANRDLRLERTAKGNLLIMPPTGWETGNRNLKISQQLANWADQDGSGLGFDSSTGFRLANGAVRSPDVAWVRRERIEHLNPAPDKFLPLCPDFVIELRSASDSLSTLQKKMEEYVANGLQLGWLINPQDKQVEIYYPDGEVSLLNRPDTLRGEAVLPDFILVITWLWTR
ncbi:Uma2 family endonuclease [Leptolyngbya cf. ectocarpi LEGE 11479]|uniref:Uma2 family endonuclease n=1 Tax=Leptolyngbya cf. ectocarpi LEGE 11479 TaxID=1828722 RepID=A0A928ZSX7_LEPEC|nr:Uma2 family endonuclease [Leptolyngbya ectocarpi]MBE9065981.1 Uma2 family endonuclease [Leptolyngbya cf. ectocarpi LEGE 11479]